MDLLQLGVPATSRFSPSGLLLTLIAMDIPKSASLTLPVLVVKILAAFRSQ